MYNKLCGTIVLIHSKVPKYVLAVSWLSLATINLGMADLCPTLHHTGAYRGTTVYMYADSSTQPTEIHGLISVCKGSKVLSWVCLALISSLV